MQERYKKLYHLKRRLYASDAPVIIESGALLLEQNSNAILCQLCFRNIQERPIKALRAVVQLLDERGRPLGKPVDHRFLDLDLKREEEYGRDTAIVLPSERAAAFTVRLSQVSFADGEVWTDEDSPWEELPRQLSLVEYCGGEEAAARFRKRHGENCSFAPLESEELWFCPCGAVNPIGESRCHRCRLRRSAVLGRAAMAKPGREGEETRFSPKKRGEKKPLDGKKRALLIGAAGLALLALLAILILPRLKSAPAAEEARPTPADSPEKAADTEPRDEQEEAYVQALALLDAGELDAAEEAFLALGDYRDSEDYLARVIPYRRALLLQEMADYAPLEDAARLYEAAAEAFEALGSYEDCAERALLCRQQQEEEYLNLAEAQYDEAVALLNNRCYTQARSAFLAIGEFRDSRELADEALYRRSLAIYDFLTQHRLVGVKASLSADPDTESVVALSREQLLELGSQGVEELTAAFGQDPVRFTTEESTMGSLQPIEQELAEQFAGLGEYQDSAELAEKLPEMIDESDAFFALCAEGELEEARSWLLAYEKPFEDRELWLGLIDRYLPYCRSWNLFAGDPSLVSQAEGGVEKFYKFHCQVLLTRDGAVLRFLSDEGLESRPEMSAELGDGRFMTQIRSTGFIAQINTSGSLTLVKLEDGKVIGGSEYVPER